MRSFLLGVLVLAWAFVTADASGAPIVTYDPFPTVLSGGRVYGGPNYTQNGVYVEHVWASSGTIFPNHTHFGTGGSSGNYEGDHDLYQLLVIEMADGSAFNLDSIGYASNGYSGNLLVSTTAPVNSTFNDAAFIAQFTAFAVGSTGGSTIFGTRNIPGFDNVTRVYLTSSGNFGSSGGSFSLDNIALSSAIVTPEPTSLAIWGVGAIGCALYARRRKSASI